jgi:heme exporter protein CcmD
MEEIVPTSWQIWFAMGGYGAYIWPCYGLAFITLASLVGASWRRAHYLERALKNHPFASDRQLYPSKHP